MTGLSPRGNALYMTAVLVGGLILNLVLIALLGALTGG
jgi:hypothetical protein